MFLFKLLLTLSGKWLRGVDRRGGLIVMERGGVGIGGNLGGGQKYKLYFRLLKLNFFMYNFVTPFR